MNVCCVFSLESPHRGDSNEYTHHAIINIKKKITLNYPKYNNVCSYRIFFQGTQERVRNSRGKRAIGVRAIEVLLYFLNICDLVFTTNEKYFKGSVLDLVGKQQGIMLTY